MNEQSKHPISIIFAENILGVRKFITHAVRPVEMNPIVRRALAPREQIELARFKEIDNKGSTICRASERALAGSALVELGELFAKTRNPVLPGVVIAVAGGSILANLVGTSMRAYAREEARRVVREVKGRLGQIR